VLNDLDEKAERKSLASVESHYRHREFARSAEESVRHPLLFPPLEALDHDEDKREINAHVEVHLHQ
jgi:hypothetical protein